MTNRVILSSNSPSVIDQSNVLSSRVFISSLMMAGYNRFICSQKLGRRGVAVVFVLDNIERLMSVDFIGKKSEVILVLEFALFHCGQKLWDDNRVRIANTTVTW